MFQTHMHTKQYYHILKWLKMWIFSSQRNHHFDQTALIAKWIQNGKEILMMQ